MALIVTGCVTNTPLSKTARDSITTVSIHRDVVSSKMTYRGQSQAISELLFGPAGGAIAAAAARGPAAQLLVAMQEAGIDVREIVRERFATDLATASIFSALVPEGADAEFNLEIRGYGFVHAPWSTALKPVLQVYATLTRRDGTVVWAKHDFVWTSNGQTPTRPLVEYLEDPTRIGDGFAAASKVVIGTIIRDLRGQ